MSNDWIDHDGGPQPVADETWLFVLDPIEGGYQSPASEADWDHARHYFILNQHLIDAKQAEIDALRDDLETWQSVFPHVMPERLKSDQQLAEEDVAAKIDAALKRGIELGLEAAAEKIAEKQDHDLREILNLDPETIAKEAQHD